MRGFGEELGIPTGECDHSVLGESELAIYGSEDLHIITHTHTLMLAFLTFISTPSCGLTPRS